MLEIEQPLQTTLFEEEPTQATQLAKSVAASIDIGAGGLFMPTLHDQQVGLGLSPDKLIIPRDYHSVVRMCYDFYQRGGSVARVIERLTEFSITEIRNGQRKTSDEANAYFRAVLHSRPSRLMRFLHTAALEYYLSGMVLPRVDFEVKKGFEISPDLIPNKEYTMPVFDLYVPLLVDIEWDGWGAKKFFIAVPDETRALIRSKGGKIKEQQERYKEMAIRYPSFVSKVALGAKKVEITDTDPILRKQISLNPYPTPYLFSVLESLVFKQQLRRMDYAVASRVINAILLVQEGDKDFPLSKETQGRLEEIKNQMLMRSTPGMQERLFALFTNHTVKLTWIHPDVQAMLDQDKYRQVNEELDEGLGFTRVLLTGTTRQGGQATEISTWAIQPQMEELRSMLIEWVSDLYHRCAELNKFRNTPSPAFKPVRLQDFVKTAAVFAQLFKEGNLSRTTRAEMAGLDLETETELMNDESKLMEGLPAFVPTPYSPLPPTMGPGGMQAPQGRPVGSQNVPVNNRNSGVKPSGQTPTSRVKAEISSESWDDETLLKKIAEWSEETGFTVTPDMILDKSDEVEET